MEGPTTGVNRALKGADAGNVLGWPTGTRQIGRRK